VEPLELATAADDPAATGCQSWHLSGASLPTSLAQFLWPARKRFTELKQFYEANLSMLRAQQSIRRNDIPRLRP